MPTLEEAAPPALEGSTGYLKEKQTADRPTLDGHRPYNQLFMDSHIVSSPI